MEKLFLSSSVDKVYAQVGRKSFSLVFLILGVLCFINCQPPPTNLPKAIKGVLDLSEWSPDDVRILPLDGEWEFYWNRIVSSEEIIQRNGNETLAYISVPSQWQKQTNSAFGYATYHLKILVPDNSKLAGLSPFSKTALHIPNIGTSFQFYINGKFILEKGKFATSRENFEFYTKPEIISLEEFLFEDQSGPKELKTKSLDLLFLVSNFEHPRAGIWDTVFIGKQKELENEKQRNLVINLILSSSLFIMGLYHFGIYLNRRKERSALYFAIFCILIGSRELAIGERFLLDAFPDFSFKVVTKIEFLSFFFGSYVFSKFFLSLFPEDCLKKVHTFFAILTVPCSIAVVIFPLRIYGQLLIPIQLNAIFMIFYIFYVIFKAIKNQRSGAILFGIGWILLSAAIIHDIVKAVGIIFSPNMVGNGLLSFIVFQAIILSRKFASAFSQSEILTERLSKISEDLEIKVKERTLSLQLAEASANEAKEIAIHQREETEALNLLLKSLNEKLDLKVIMQKVKEYIQDKYKIQHYGLSVVDESREYLNTIQGDFPEFLSDSEFEYASTARTRIQGVVGGHAFAFKAKKPFFIPRVRKTAITDEESRIHDYLKFESLLIIPLILENEPMGFLDLFNVGKWEIKKDDITKLSILGEQLAGIIYASKLFSEIQIKTIELKETLDIVQEDLHVAKRIQESLLVPNVTDLDPLEIYTCYLPMQQIGGDLYDITKINDHLFRIFIADATGHGVQAALITMAIKGIYESIKAYELDLGSLMEIFNNEFVHRYLPLNSLLTAMILEINCKEETVSYVSAGHPSAIVIRKDSTELLSKTGRIIGVKKQNNYETNTVSFPRGSRLFVFTDGIYEQFNESLTEFGEERLHDSLVSSKEESLDFSISKVLKELEFFLSGGKFQDDITFVGVQYSTVS